MYFISDLLLQHIPITTVILSVLDLARSMLPTADRRNLPQVCVEFSSCISSVNY